MLIPSFKIHLSGARKFICKPPFCGSLPRVPAPRRVRGREPQVLPDFTPLCRSAFLPDPILQGLAAVGKYDGKHPTLTCATKCVVFSPTLSLLL